MSRSFFSIITCTRNSGKFVKKNITSVRRQTFKDYEHIFIDGYSLDKTNDIIDTYAHNNPKVRVYKYSPNGISNAFNLGIKHSNGKYIIFLNSDDYFYDNDVLGDAAKFLKENEQPDWIFGIINVVEENGKRVGLFPKFILFKKELAPLLKLINYIPHQSSFIKKEIFENYGKFDEGLTSQMDYDLWLKIASHTRWKFYERLISNYSIRKGAMSSSKKNSKENIRNMRTVQARYTNKVEFFVARIAEFLVQIYNKIYNKTTR
jgi:glycosyltransferase involved in cell wall biosynthesis